MTFHSLSENNILKILSAISFVTCAGFYFLGLKLEIISVQILFGLFFCAYLLCYVGFYFQKTQWFKSAFLFLVCLGVFILNELLGEQLKIIIMFPMELGFVFVFYKNSPRLRWVFLLIISAGFLISTNGQIVFMDPIKLPEMYGFFSGQLLSIISLCCLWLSLEYSHRNVQYIEGRGADTHTNLNNTKNELHTIKNLMVSPLEDIISIGEVIAYSRNPEEMSDYLKIWNKANARVYRLMKSIDGLSSSFNIDETLRWKSVDVNQFCLLIEDHLVDLELGHKIEYKIDEALYHKNLILPQELLEQWVLDIIGAISEIPKFDFDELLSLNVYKEKEEFVFDLKTLFIETEEICIPDYEIQIKNISNLIYLETRNLGVSFEFSFHQGYRRFVFKFPLNNTNKVRYDFGFSEEKKHLSYKDKSKIILVSIDKIRAEISKRRFALIGIDVVVFNSLLGLEKLNLNDDYRAIIIEVNQLSQENVDWALKCRYHTNVFFREIPIVFWVESVGDLNQNRIKQIPFLKIHTKPSSIDELVDLFH